MKNLKNLITAVADEYRVPADEVADGIRAYLAYLLEDPDFRRSWEEIPKPEGMSEEEVLLGLMIALPDTEPRTA